MFQLHPQLAADTLALGHLDLCQVLLMNDRRYPWLILVPQRRDITELHQLGSSDQQSLMLEITGLSAPLQQHSNADKINVASLGNMVPQCHVHLVARFKQDPAWPGPVWGVGTAQPWSEEEGQQQQLLWRQRLSPAGLHYPH